MAELDLLDKIIGGNFVERWLEWNGFEEALREWRKVAPRPLSESQTEQIELGRSALD
jgi:hypothetical protein